MYFGTWSETEFTVSHSMAETIGYSASVKTIAFIGAGGKTTLLCRLAEELASQGKNVLISTTTHLQYPFPIDNYQEKITIAGNISGNKITPILQSDLTKCAAKYDILLYEADGAHHRPIKYPAEYEPVLLPDTDIVISVLGLDAIGQRIIDIAHRPKLLAAALNVPIGHQLLPEDLKIIFPALINKQENLSKKQIFILNKVNTSQDLTTAARLADIWPEERSQFMIAGNDKQDNTFIKICDQLKRSTPVLCAAEVSPFAGKMRLIDRFHPLHTFDFSSVRLPCIVPFDETDYYVERISPAPHLIIAGGGHVALATAKIAAILGMTVTIVEPRSEFATKDRFPMAAAIYNEPYETGLARDFGENVYYVVLTHGHTGDTTALQTILKKPSKYIGMIGSRKKNAHVFAQLQAAGYTTAEIKKVHAPIGLAIGAITPEEIAVSITAEIISIMNQQTETKANLELFELAATSVINNQPFVTACIVNKEGSAPRGIGARLLITADGIPHGTIGGGPAELSVINEAKKMLSKNGSTLKTISMNTSETPDVSSMVCGGEITVLIESVQP